MRIFLTVIFYIICVALIVIVLLQEGKSAGLVGDVSGIADTYWGKNKGRSMEGALQKATRFLVIAFMVIALLLNTSL